MNLLFLWACTQAPTSLLKADPSRDGVPGHEGPYGALALHTTVAARVTEAFDVDLVIPVDADEAPANNNWPVIVLIQGGLVDPERYLWMATHWASRGYATVVPDFPMDLALFASDNAVSALRELRQHPPELVDPIFSAETPAAVVGHSLGGVVATRAWLAEPDTFSVLGLWASYPASGDDVSVVDDRHVLSLIGSDDGKAPLETTRAGAERFGDPVWFGVVDGMNHYGWTDDASEKELASDGKAGRSVSDARNDVNVVIDTFLDAHLRADSSAITSLENDDFSGISEE
jgi:pimeloyl-ACP methyl ester carboxylesterase